jgi:hypothetical protein
VSSAALEAVERALDRGGDPDDVLRGVVAALVEHGGCAWAGILLVEGGELVLGPEAGEQRPAKRMQVPVDYRGDHVADLVVDGCDDPALPGRVAAQIGELCLVGWDTGGVPWDASG